MTPEQIAQGIHNDIKMRIDSLRDYYARNNKTTVMSADTTIILEVLERQQKIIEYLLERENERMGDGK